MTVRSLLLLTLLPALGARTPAQALEKWIYCQTNLQVEANVGKLDDLMRRGAAAGYTHLLLADSKLAKLGADLPEHYFKNTAKVQEFAARHRIEVVPAIFNIGYSNAMLWHDPNLIEAMPVKDAPLVVKDGAAQIASDLVPLPGGDFSDLKKWAWKDENVVADGGAARVTDPAGKPARIVQKLKLQPWRQYHFSVRLKTQELQGGAPEVKVLPPKDASLTWSHLHWKPTQDWTVQHVVFNSQDNTEAQLYLGTWGAKSGSLWWDDAQLDEVAFVNLARRPGCPLVIKSADGETLIEGTDFEPLRDPLLGTKPWAGEYDNYHEPPLLKLKSRVPDGTRLRASYYHGATVHDGQSMACPSEPKTYELLRDEISRVHKLWGAKGYMMSHDEVRVMNWCAACQARKLTPGQQLADNVKRCIQLIREVAPDARIHTWSDMFDPHHNAVKSGYYLVNGDLTGSWEGLDKEVVILPWYFEKRAESLKFFAERGHRQIVAGYYDAKPEGIKEWLSAAQPFRTNLLGVMYTTWQSKFADLEAFSQAAEQAQ